jgi:integrase
MRLSEAAGLMIDDLKLNEDIPYIDLKPHPHRRLKTASSERKIPLVGTSLWAAKRLKQHSAGLYCFSRYTNPERCNSNSASAAINKWIKTVGGSNDVIHGLRHSFRDRLRAVEAPTDMIDQLGGWALKSVGQGYGDGYDLELLISCLTKITTN